MPLYRQIMPPVEAVQWDGEAITANRFVGEAFGTDWWYAEGSNDIMLPGDRKPMRVQVGNWIVRGRGGGLYQVGPEWFAKTFEPVEDTDLAPPVPMPPTPFPVPPEPRPGAVDETPECPP